MENIFNESTFSSEKNISNIRGPICWTLHDQNQKHIYWSFAMEEYKGKMCQLAGNESRKGKNIHRRDLRESRF